MLSCSHWANHGTASRPALSVPPQPVPQPIPPQAPWAFFFLCFPVFAALRLNCARQGEREKEPGEGGEGDTACGWERGPPRNPNPAGEAGGQTASGWRDKGQQWQQQQQQANTRPDSFALAILPLSTAELAGHPAPAHSTIGTESSLVTSRPSPSQHTMPSRSYTGAGYHCIHIGPSVDITTYVHTYTPEYVHACIRTYSGHAQRTAICRAGSVGGGRAGVIDRAIVAWEGCYKCTHPPSPRYLSVSILVRYLSGVSAVAGLSVYLQHDQRRMHPVDEIHRLIQRPDTFATRHHPSSA